MQTKKIIGIALVAALVGSMAAITASAAPMTSNDDFADISTLGIVGSLTDWGGSADIPMSDPDGDGIYVGIVTDITAGDYEFKVRADSNWDNSWGEYEEDYDRTFNSQTNCKLSVADTTDLIVTLDTNGDDFNLWPVSYISTETATPSKYGAVGSMTSWGGDADAPMYEYADGKYVGVLKGVEAGDQEFKVRADSSWDESYGVYEEDYDRTNNSQTNCKVTLADASNIIVELDTTGDDEILWPVSYFVVNSAQEITESVYTGKEVEEESQVSQVSQESQESQESQVSQVSQESQESQESTEPSYYETQISDYIFFDNSQTKWDEVYAYWWHGDYARTYDLEDKDWGCAKKVNEDGTEGYEPTKFPGTKMTQIPGTDIWQARIPFNAQNIIFGSGKSDEQIQAGEIGYQTKDLKFDEKENAGQIYTIDTSVEAVAGRGVEKTKYKYNEGAWTKYEGTEYVQEIIGKKVEPSTNPQESSNTSSTSSTASKTSTTTTTSTSTSTTVDVPQTGEIAMAVAFITVATAALGAIVLAKKKRED